MILPALTEADGPFWRPIKYSLFPPLGLATLAAYLSPDEPFAAPGTKKLPYDSSTLPVTQQTFQTQHIA